MEIQMPATLMQSGTSSKRVQNGKNEKYKNRDLPSAPG